MNSLWLVSRGSLRICPNEGATLNNWRSCLWEPVPQQIMQIWVNEAREGTRLKWLEKERKLKVDNLKDLFRFVVKAIYLIFGLVTNRNWILLKKGNWKLPKAHQPSKIGLWRSFFINLVSLILLLTLDQQFYADVQIWSLISWITTNCLLICLITHLFQSSS